jgi:hypothetical protein
MQAVNSSTSYSPANGAALIQTAAQFTSNATNSSNPAPSQIVAPVITKPSLSVLLVATCDCV